VEKELAVVHAYLDIGWLRLGERLKVEQTIDPRLLDALMPPFSFRPLVENSIASQQPIDYAVSGIASGDRFGDATITSLRRGALAV
jgi:LytS/YehU family sensor histidine kinase